MNKETNIKTDVGQSEAYETVYFESTQGESLAFKISPTGLSTIWAVKTDENTTLGSIVVSGLTPEQASKKSKGFWRTLWDKIKKFVEEVIDAVTFPIGPFTCRPSAQVGFQNGKPNSLIVGPSCRQTI
jgi:hypothetical protein